MPDPLVPLDQFTARRQTLVRRAPFVCAATQAIVAVIPTPRREAGPVA
jgi:hypothetical protein